jgi:hypothetical protein
MRPPPQNHSPSRIPEPQQVWWRSVMLKGRLLSCPWESPVLTGRLLRSLARMLQCKDPQFHSPLPSRPPYNNPLFSTRPWGCLTSSLLISNPPISSFRTSSPQLQYLRVSWQHQGMVLPKSPVVCDWMAEVVDSSDIPVLPRFYSLLGDLALLRHVKTPL